MERKVDHHPDFERLLDRVGTLVDRAGPVRVVVYRCCEPAYATTEDLLTGEGSRRYGGRWNPPASFATVYAAFSDMTALAESKANHIYYGFDAVDALPRTLVAIDARMGQVLDLTDGAVRRALGVSATRMRADDWRKLNRTGTESLTQAIGRAGYGSGLEGLVVPACDGRRNLVWFPGNLRAASKLAIRNADRLG